MHSPVLANCDMAQKGAGCNRSRHPVHCYAATLCKVMQPPGTTLWLFRNFDEEQPIMPEKTHIPLSAADVKRPRPYKTSEINIRLSIFATNEQYHQMCGRANVMPPPDWAVKISSTPQECSEIVVSQNPVFREVHPAAWSAGGLMPMAPSGSGS